MTVTQEMLGGEKLVNWLLSGTLINILHETYPCDALIFDHTALAVAPCFLLPVLPSAIWSFVFAGRGFHSSDPRTARVCTKTSKHITFKTSKLFLGFNELFLNIKYRFPVPVSSS